MNFPSDSSSSSADSDSGISSPLSAGLPTPKPAKSKLPSGTPKPIRTRKPPSSNSTRKTPFRIDTQYEFENTVADKLHRNRSQLSSFVTSTILHTIVFVILGLWALDQNSKIDIGLTATLDMSEVEESLQPPSEIAIESPEVAESPIDDLSEDTSKDVEEMASSDVPTIVDTVPKESAISSAIDPSALAPLKTFPTGGGLEGRDADSRAKLAARFGGSEGSEAAVEAGLKWIINHQCSNGSWEFRHHRSECNGRCGNEGNIDANNAATGLALMALLGAGNTHQSGKYQGQVAMGLDYLVNEINYRGYGGSLIGNDYQSIYCHAIATIALAEAYAMTGDERLKKPVTEAYRYIVTSQHGQGGWKYFPQKPGDMSVTGWVVMAIKSCENAGIETSEKTKAKAQDFINSLKFADGVRYGYEISGKGDIKHAVANRKPSCTAIGNLMQMYFGRELEHPELRSACQYLADAGSSGTDIYFDYYATLLLHHARAPQWKHFNLTVRDNLIRTQQKHGHEAGSWFFPDVHGSVGGRVYTTAMAVMTLEVYYRFMPLYKIEDGEMVHAIDANH